MHCKSLTIRLLTSMLLLVLYSVQAYAQLDSIPGVPKDSTQSLDSVHLTVGTSDSGVDSPIVYKAQDSIRMNVGQKKIYLYNESRVEYGDMVLEAYYIEVDMNTNQVYARGQTDSTGEKQGLPHFESGGKSFTADEMWYNFKTKKGISTLVLTSEGGGFIRGDKFLRDSQENVYVKNASYTTCNAPEPHFHIQARKMKLVRNKQVVSGPAVLKFGNISTPLFVPFGFFPLNTDRKKGLLIGSLSNSGSRGYYLNGFGYYLPINEYLDMQVNSDIYFRGSWGFDVRTNYYRKYKYRGVLRFQYNKNKFGEEESPDFNIQNDYALNWTYRKDAKARPGSSFNASVNFKTKNQSRNNSEDIQDIVSTNANSSVNYSKAFFNNKLNFTTNARMTQNLSTGDINLDLPNFNLNLNRTTPFSDISGKKSEKKILRNLGFTYSSRFQNTIAFNEDSVFVFDRESETKKVLNSRILEDVRNGMQHNIPISTNFKFANYFNVTPSFNYTEYWYTKTTNKLWNVDSNRVDEISVNGFERVNRYNSSISMSTTVYGQGAFKHGKIAAIRHIITPSLSASFSPDFTEGDRFGYRDIQTDSEGTISRYSIFEDGIVGHPSGGRQGSLNFGLGNNLELKVRTKKDTTNGGIKKVKILESLRFGAGYNFLADSLNLSQISMNGNTVLFKRVNVNFRSVFDPYQYHFNTGTQSYKAVNKFEIKKGKLARFVGGGISMSANLNPNAKDKVRQTNRNWLGPQYSNYEVDFDIPWSMRLNYALNYSKPYGADAISSQSVTFTGDIKLTDYWKIGYSSGYNFASKEMTITKIDMHRDLHCWEFSFSWIPIGQYRRFDFTLRVKANTLKDLKISKRAFWYDN
jgi:hypothetical protein